MAAGNIWQPSLCLIEYFTKNVYEQGFQVQKGISSNYATAAQVRNSQLI
jgi:hypothetical protein